MNAGIDTQQNKIADIDFSNKSWEKASSVNKYFLQCLPEMFYTIT